MRFIQDNRINAIPRQAICQIGQCCRGRFENFAETRKRKCRCRMQIFRHRVENDPTGRRRLYSATHLQDQAATDTKDRGFFNSFNPGCWIGSNQTHLLAKCTLEQSLVVRISESKAISRTTVSSPRPIWTLSGSIIGLTLASVTFVDTPDWISCEPRPRVPVRSCKLLMSSAI